MIRSNELFIGVMQIPPYIIAAKHEFLVMELSIKVQVTLLASNSTPIFDVISGDISDRRIRYLN